MRFVDLSSSSRMSSLLELTRALRGCQSPWDALVMYCRYLRNVLSGSAQVVLSTRGLEEGQYKVWRFLGDDGIENIELTAPWGNTKLPVYQGGVLGKIIADPTPHLIHDLDWSDDPHFAEMFGPFRSMMAVPLFHEGLPLSWSMMLTRKENHFDLKELEDSVARAALAGTLIGSLHVSRELAEAHAHIDSALERMALIQRALLPEPIPEIPGLRLAASYETFGQVGGDLYDFIPLDDGSGRWCLFIGDASGHGPSAAVVAAMVQTTLHDCADRSAGPGELFQVLNRRLCQKRIEGSFVTAFMGFYEPETRSLRYASAGHPFPLVRTDAGGPRQLVNTAVGMPLGVDDEGRFDELAVQLRPAETLLLYTDGITEAKSPEGIFFGDAGIERALETSAGEATAVVERVRSALLRHQGGRRPNDDQTVVAIQVDGSSGD
jgi:phosphoserine phosphatase RsbU/P